MKYIGSIKIQNAGGARMPTVRDVAGAGLGPGAANVAPILRSFDDGNLNTLGPYARIQWGRI